jgi:hypothetical protein
MRSNYTLEWEHRYTRMRSNYTLEWEEIIH